MASYIDVFIHSNIRVEYPFLLVIEARVNWQISFSEVDSERRGSSFVNATSLKNGIKAAGSVLKQSCR